jgi:hypothetical protein
MAYKSILTILTDPKEVAPVLGAAVSFAESQGAHLEVLCLGIDRTQTGYYFAGATTLLHEETIMHAQTEAHAIETAARAELARSAISWGVDAMVSQSASVSGLVARRARYADLVIVPKPYGDGQYSDAPIIVEAAMFNGHAPAIVLSEGALLPGQPDRKSVV